MAIAPAMQGSSHILLVIIQLQNLIDGRSLGGSWRRLWPQSDGAVVPLAACTGSAKREKDVCVSKREGSNSGSSLLGNDPTGSRFCHNL